MDKARLNTIRERLEATTSGTWCAGTPKEFSGVIIWPMPDGLKRGPVCGIPYRNKNYAHDAAFIETAKGHISELMIALEEAWLECDTLRLQLRKATEKRDS